MTTIDICLFETGEVIETLKGEEEKTLTEANEYLCNNSLIFIDCECYGYDDHDEITLWVK